jgi:hypothetical protein
MYPGLSDVAKARVLHTYKVDVIFSKNALILQAKYCTAKFVH